MRTGNRFIGIFFLVVIFIVMLYTVIPPSGRLLDFVFSEPAFDTLAAYPYTNAGAVDEEAPTGITGLISHTYTLFNQFKNLVSRYASADSFSLVDFAVGKRWVDRVMGLDMTASLTAGENDVDAVAVWQEDYLAYVVHDSDNALLIKNITDLGKQMLMENRNFIFLMTPEKQAKTLAFPDYSEEQRWELLQALREQSLDTIDVTAIIEERQMDMKDLFFKTDHHWLPSTGVWADQLLCEFMNENYGYRIDTSIFDPENYDTIILEDKWIGSQGKKVTTVYCEKEDFPLIIPKYNTNLEVFISGNNERSAGGIQDTLFGYERFVTTDPQKIYSWNPYGLYGYGDQELITIHNNDIHDGSSMLIIKTSAANVMFPYLSATVEDLYVVDPRHFKGSLRTLINETDPDTVVIVARNASFAGEYDLSDVIEN